LNTAGVGFSGFREAEEKSLESLMLYKGALEETNTELLRFKQLGSQNSKQLAENFKKEEKEARILKAISDGYATANTELGRFGQLNKDNSQLIDELNKDKFPAFNAVIKDSTDFLGRFDEFSARTFTNFADYLTDAVMTGKASFKDFARSVLRDLASVIIRQQLAIATQRIFGGMGGTTNVLSTIGGAISGIFGRANGGTVQANKPYLIGERGAELFVPNTNGTVVPNNQMKSSATNVNITINTVDARGIDELLTDRRSTIVNLINDALNSQGREALV